MCNEINFPHILVNAHLIICFLYRVAVLLLALILFKIRNAIEELMLLGSSNSQQIELGSARVERDNNDFLEILTWFRNHNPFTTSEKLVCLDSGFIDENNTVNCDKAELIGACIQKSLNNRTFASCSFKRRDQITNLQSLYSSTTINKERVAIDPLTLFYN